MHKLTCKWRSVPRRHTHTSEKSNPLPGEPPGLGREETAALELLPSTSGKRACNSTSVNKMTGQESALGKRKYRKILCRVLGFRSWSSFFRSTSVPKWRLSFPLSLFISSPSGLPLPVFFFFFFSFVLFLASRFRVLASPNSALWHDKSESF